MTWKRATLRAAAEVTLGRQRSPAHAEGPHMRPYLRAANVKDGVLDLASVHSMNFSPQEQAVFSLRPGDVLVTEGSGSIGSVGATSVWRGEIEGVICFQNTLLRLRPRAGTDPNYLQWWARAAHASGLFASIASGANIYHISAERVRALPVTLPPLEEQRRIADFLDAETAHVDRLIELNRLQASLLEERRWSHFQSLLDSASLANVQLRRVLISIIDGPFGSAFTSAQYVDEGAKVVRLGNIGFGAYRAESQAYIPFDLFEKFRRYSVREGDVMIAGLGDAKNHAGRACVAPNLGHAIVKGKCFRARVNFLKADPEFVALLLSSPIGAASFGGRGSTRSMINVEIVKSTVFPMPDLETQLQVVADTRTHWRSLGRMIEGLKRQEVLLEERRRALITAAVTGELDVTTARRVS